MEEKYEVRRSIHIQRSERRAMPAKAKEEMKEECMQQWVR